MYPGEVARGPGRRGEAAGSIILTGKEYRPISCGGPKI